MQRKNTETVLNTISISIGDFSIKAEGEPALVMSNLIKEYSPVLAQSIKQKGTREILKELRGIVYDYLNNPTTPTPSRTISTD